MKIKYLLLLSVICQQSITLKCQETLRSFGFANDGPDPFVQARERNQKLAEQKEQKQNAAQKLPSGAAEYMPTEPVANFSDDCMEAETKTGMETGSGQRIVDCLPGDLTTNLILPYGFEVDGSSPEALCESLTDYILMLRAKFPEIAEQVITQIKRDKLVKKYLEEKVFGPFQAGTHEQDKIFRGINVKDKEGNTALHFAAQRGYFETAEVLIANDIDINALASNRTSGRSFKLISFERLTEFRGAPVTFENTKKIKEVFAKNNQNKSIEKVLVNVMNWHALNDAIINGHMDIAKLILQNKQVADFTNAIILIVDLSGVKTFMIYAFGKQVSDLVSMFNFDTFDFFVSEPEAKNIAEHDSRHETNVKLHRLMRGYLLDLDLENGFSLNDILNSYLQNDDKEEKKETI